MVVDRGHQEHAFSRALEIQHLDDDAQRLDHEQTADDGQDDLVLGCDGDCTQRAAKGERSGVAHEHGGGRCVIPQEPKAAADQASAEHQNLA